MSRAIQYRTSERVFFVTVNDFTECIKAAFLLVLKAVRKKSSDFHFVFIVSYYI